MHLVACQAAGHQTLTDESERSIREFRGHLVLGHEVRSFKPCTSEQESWRESPGDAVNQPLTINELKSGEYRSEWSAKGKIKLNDGIYQEKVVPESATELVIKLSDKMAFGDLNGDGAEDAAVILVSDPGGSGTFYDLAAVINSGGKANHAASVFLGDRVKVEDISIRTGQIVVTMVTHQRTDPLCCPSLEVEQKYALQGDALVRQPVEMKASERR